MNAKEQDAPSPGAWLEDPPREGASVAETHSAVVFFFADLAYKVKKPLDLGFLDFSRRDTRRAVCEREVELNRRLSPDVYLGVGTMDVPAVGMAEPVVVMRRLPASRRLSRLARDGLPLERELDALAETIAAFHERATRGHQVDRAATSRAVLAQWETNTRAMRKLRAAPFSEGTLDHMDALARRYHAGRQLLFDQRIEEHRICDGHGDLLADDIFLLDDGPRVLDCLEFDDTLRHLDTLSDVATLAMDLEAVGRRDLSARWLDAYRKASRDQWPPSLAHHYIAYRAQVRALVAGVRHDQGDADAATSARRLVDLCLHHLKKAQVQLVLVGGLPGTGKSTLAASIADALGATVIRSDEVRHRLFKTSGDSAADDGFDGGRYAPSATDATYRTMMTTARTLLSGGQHVVVDATFRRESNRRAARRTADEAFADIQEFRCVAPRDLTERRIVRRLRAGHDPSEATPEIARRMEGSFDPWPTALDVDTGTTDAPGPDPCGAATAGEGRRRER